VRGLGVDLTWSGREQTKTAAAAAAVVRAARKRGWGAGRGRRLLLLRRERKLHKGYRALSAVSQSSKHPPISYLVHSLFQNINFDQIYEKISIFYDIKGHI
jgi:hypothetical protein